MSEQQAAAQSTNQAATANQSQQTTDANSQQQQSANSNQTQQTTQTQQSQQQSASSGQTQQQSAPDKYEFKAPEGVTLAPEFVDEITTLSKSLGLSNEKAQELLNSQYAKASNAEALQKQQLKERNDAWKKQALEDKEIGGEGLNQNIEMAKRVLTKFFPEPVIKFIDESGFGNYPDFLRGFVRLGKMMEENKIVVGGSGDSSSSKSRAARMFDKSNHV